MKYTIIFAIAVLSLVGCASDNTPSETTLGTISFTPYGEKIAQPHFQKGLLLMHNFEYDDARTSFLKAQELDSNFHMAYWGEAMSYNHPLWHSQKTDEAREALHKLAPTAAEREAKATNELERDLIQAANILFADGKDKLDRDVSYSEYMRTLYLKYDGNHEVAAFYALSILGADPERDAETYGKGAIVVQGILKENPEHPGALHYLIHSYDDPQHAHLALEAANSYAVVAKDAGHALHMPSHIYVASGMWDEVVSSNIASFAASEERKARLDLDNNALGYHALQWLMYGYLQRNDLDTAKGLLLDMKRYHDELPSPRARAYLTMMRAGYLVDSKDWGGEMVNYEIEDSALNVSLRAVNMFIAGAVAFYNGDSKTLEATIDQMAEMRDASYKKMMQRYSSSCSGVNWTSKLPTETDINIAHIMEMQLQAFAAMLTDDAHETDKWLKAAADLEDNTTYSFGPPSVVKPSHELYGEWLYSVNRTQEGHVHVAKAFSLAPGRRLILELMRDGGDSSPAI